MSALKSRSGPLVGMKVIELAGIGPAPFCAMLLSDLGAEVIRVERPGSHVSEASQKLGFIDILTRGRHSIELDLKAAVDLEFLCELIDVADLFIEGFRPGVVEKLGIGPEQCWESNPALVYGRMTGWGQDGPLASLAGHDINYIALSGALHAIGRADEPPTIPLNLVGDFGGGGMFLAFGVLAALWEARRTGQGQIVDASMLDGATLLTTMFHGMMATNYWEDRRGVNIFDSGSHFYNVYETADSRFVAVGAVERVFYDRLLAVLGFSGVNWEDQHNKSLWRQLRKMMGDRFLERTLDDWIEAFDGVDACFSPVLSFGEVDKHAHARARGLFQSVDGVKQPSPAPRFSRTPGGILRREYLGRSRLHNVLSDWGVEENALYRFLHRKD